MAELLLRVVDKLNSDFYLNTKFMKRGDVVWIVPDGWSWGSAELKSPEWRILSFPGINTEDLSGYLTPEFDVDPHNPSKTLQKRQFKFDINAFLSDQPSFSPIFNDDRRSQTVISTPLGLNSILSYKVMKPPIADIAVIG